MAKPRQKPRSGPAPAVVARATLPPLTPALILVAAVVLAYLPALGAGFIWDDDAYVTRNLMLRSLGGLWRIWTEPGATPQYYPLTFTSFWLEYHLWGLAPAGYHATNVILHAANAVLVWRILVALEIPGALAAAAIFALHPVQVESVAWITERKNVLSGLFYLASAKLYLECGARRRSEAQSGALRRTPDWLPLALFAAALLSKTVTCSLPAALLLVLWWKRGRLERADVLPLLPFFALGAALAGVTVWMEKSHVGAAGADWHLSLLDRVLIAGRALWFYAATLSWPASLSFVYPRWEIDAADPRQYVYPLAALAVAVAAFAARHRLGRGPMAAGLFFAGTLLPALGFFDVFPMRYTFVADHYQYLACVGLIVLAVAAASRLVERRPRAVASGLAAAVCGVLAILTWRQTHAYEGPYALWNDTLAKSPTVWMAHHNLGLLHQQEGRLEEAAAHYRGAIAVKPDDDFAMNNLGYVLHGLGRPREATVQLRAAIAVNSANAEAHSNLGNVLASEGDLDTARAELEEAIRLRPAYPEARNNLANVFSMQGRGEEALRQYQEALRLDPDYAEAHGNLAALLAANGHNDAAAEHLGAVVLLKPADAEGWYRLGIVLANAGRRPEAMAALERAVQLAGREEHRRALAELQSGAGS